ncbi:MAG: helix-turn-helix transcriptional regulator [Alistipes sp.]|nr:helix-turn-helix transcriptional regulator [Alistipes sp.]
MTKKSIFPYYTEVLRSVDGLEVSDVGGAAMMHFEDVDIDQMPELKYPCRIDALVIVVCLRGEVSFSSQLNNYTLSENQFFISSASVIQFYSLADSEAYFMAFTSEFLANMNIDVRVVGQLISRLGTGGYIVDLNNDELQGVSRFLATLHDHHRTDLMSEYRMASLCHVYCAMIYRIVDALVGREVAVVSMGVKERSSEYFEKLMSLLSEHYREERGVEFYAEKMHISSKHLSRVIRSYTGRSVHQWIDEFVALEIKNLLKYSNMSIQQISYFLNFPNPSFMGQYFKRITGMTPGEYKKS